MELFLNGPDNRVCCLMRGIPGCGKSRRASQITCQDQIFSADTFYGTGEEYKKNWTRERAHLGHRDCEAKVKSAMAAGKSPIVVDNTNIALQNFRVYIDYAIDHGYQVNFVYPDSPWWLELVVPFLRKKTGVEADKVMAAEIAAKIHDKNVHGVPQETLVNMMMNWTWPTLADYAASLAQRIEAAQDEVNLLTKRYEFVK